MYLCTLCIKMFSVYFDIYILQTLDYFTAHFIAFFDLTFYYEINYVSSL